jgi:hypothetical protein
LALIYTSVVSNGEILMTMVKKPAAKAGKETPEVKSGKVDRPVAAAASAPAAKKGGDEPKKKGK